MLFGCDRTIKIGNKSYTIKYFFKDEKVIEFIESILDHDFEKVENLVKDGLDINAIGKDGMTPLFLCFAGKNIEGFKKLLELGANPNYVVKDGPALLNLCISEENSRYLEELLKHGGDPNKVFENHQHPLNDASTSGKYIDNFILLLKYGADPNFSMDVIDNPVIEALRTRQYKYVQILLENGAKIFSSDKLKKNFIEKMESYVQFEGTKEFNEQKELVRYLKESYDIVINLKYPNGRPKSEMK